MRQIHRIGPHPGSVGVLWGPLLSNIATGVGKGLELYGGYKAYKAAGKAPKAPPPAAEPPVQTGFIDRTTVTAQVTRWLPLVAVGLGLVLLARKR